jgi:hypothetical protein
MSRRPGRPSLRSRRVLAVVAGALLAGSVAGLAGAVSGASAASLGGLRSSTLFAQKPSTSAISDSFSYASGTKLNGMTSPTGGLWTVTGGSLVVTSTASVRGETTATAYGTVPFSSCNTQIGVDIRSSGSSTFGLLINAHATGTPSTAVLYNNSGAGTITLARVSATGVRTPWASVTQIGGGNVVRVLSVRYFDGVYTVRFDNAVVLTFTVPTADRTAVQANCNVGIMVDSDTKSTFDNFQAYAL